MRRRSAYLRRLSRFATDCAGATLVEFTIVLSVFIFIFFGLIDFGRLGFAYVMAEKATQMAARTAAVRPPVCAGVPLTHARGTVPPGTIPPKFGTKCSVGGGTCANPGVISCSGSPGDPTAQEVWTRIGGLLPNNATVANLQFSYAYDQNLGFLGGPYVPVVTVELQNLNFDFFSPLAALAAFAGANNPPAGLGASIAMPPMSVSLPGEDLALGEAG